MGSISLDWFCADTLQREGSEPESSLHPGSHKGVLATSDYSADHSSMLLDINLTDEDRIQDCEV